METQRSEHLFVCSYRNTPSTGETKACPVCELWIYAVIGIIALLTAALQFILASLAGVHAPRADAYHIASDGLSDFVGIIINFLVIRYASKEHAIRIGGAYIQAILLLFAGLLVLHECIEALERFFKNEPMDPYLGFLAAIIGIVGNGIRLWILGVRKGGWSINRMIQDKHVRSDFYSSIVASITVLLIILTGIEGWDIIGTFFIYILILRWTLYAFKSARKGNIHVH